MRSENKIGWIVAAVAAALVVLSSSAVSSQALGHCDTMDGPLVATGMTALDTGNVTPTLKWVRATDEEEITTALKLAQAARAQGGAAKTLADRYFLETLVRLHRTGEGASFTGIKPAGMIDPVIAAADAALISENVDAVVKQVQDNIATEIRQRFARAHAARANAERDVKSGRSFVEAYIEYVHYVERLIGAHREESAGSDPETHNGSSSIESEGHPS